MSSLKITWLCQAGFIFEADGKRIVVDPYMSNRLYENARRDKGMDRMMPNPVPYEQLNPTLVLFTHDHGDHYDEESVREIVGVYPDCKFAGPTSALNHFVKDGYNSSNYTKLDIGDNIKGDGFEVRALVAHHSDPLAAGYIIIIGGKTVYISGDTLFNTDLAESVAKTAGRHIDIMCICINGKLGNMAWNEAVEVVKSIKPSFVYPMHYGLFARNTEDPQPFINAVKALGISVEEPTVNGRSF